MDTAAVQRNVEEVLGPTLRPGQMVVLDNLSVHKADSIYQAIEAGGCELLFLPAYSPDCTPVERAFSKVKALLRERGAHARDALLDALRLALEAITRKDAVAWFAHTRYTLPGQAP